MNASSPGPSDPFRRGEDPEVDSALDDLADLDDERLDAEDDDPPLDLAEREAVTADLADVEVFRALLGPRGVRGLVVDCDDCHQAHYFDWDLLLANLRSLLDAGRSGVHEPAFEPDPVHYVSWDYAKGFSDAVAEEATDRGAA